jgi:hypothetical protein
LLYSAILVLLGYMAIRRGSASTTKRVGYAAIALGLSSVVAQWLVPAGMNLLGMTFQGSFDRPSGPDWESTQDESVGLRLLAWQLAFRIFATSPWIGVGPGEFAGAGFSLGLPPALAAREIWTSPHNLVLQLLAETGIAGTALACTGIWIWFRGAIPEFSRAPTSAGWWIVVCASVEMSHALLEYPFWYAHFLALSALVFGIGSASAVRMPTASVRAVLSSGSIAAAILLGITLRDYLRFDLASPIYAGRSLAPDADFQRDLDTLAALSGGLLAPRAELWWFLSVPVSEHGLAAKVTAGTRVIRTWPLFEVVLRQCIFLALAGRESEARLLFSHAIKTFPKRRTAMLQAIESAPLSAHRVLEPLLRP